MSMDLMASGALTVMNSMGSLESASKKWQPGDRVVFIFPVLQFDHPITKLPVYDIPVATKYGHKIEFGKDSGFSRSWVPSRYPVDRRTNEPVDQKDFAYQVAPIFGELFRSEKEFEYKVIDDTRPDEESRKAAKADIDEAFKKKSPAVGPLRLKAYMEIIVVKVDANNKVISNYEYCNYNVSRTKLASIVKSLGDTNAYSPGAKYMALILPTDSTKKKAEAGQADFAIPDSSKRLEVVNPEFATYVEELFKVNNPTPETIAGKAYDFKDYNENDLKTAAANYLTKRAYYFNENNTQNLRKSVQTQRNADIFKMLGFIAQADQIEKALGASTPAPTATTPQGGDVAQTFNAPVTDPAQAAVAAQAAQVAAASQTLTADQLSQNQQAEAASAMTGTQPSTQPPAGLGLLTQGLTPQG